MSAYAECQTCNHPPVAGVVHNSEVMENISQKHGWFTIYVTTWAIQSAYCAFMLSCGSDAGFQFDWV